MNDGGFFGNAIAIIIAICVSLPILVLFVWSVFWSYRDAEKRGKSGCLVAILVFFLSWPLGLILWLIFRPDEKYF